MLKKLRREIKATGVNWMNKALCLAVLIIIAGIAIANVPLVALDAPAQVQAGIKFGVSVQVNHLNPNKEHYIDWIRVYAGNEVVAEKTYSSPQANAVFAEAFEVTLTKDANLTAEAHCTVHGVGRSETRFVAVQEVNETECHLSLCDCKCYPAGHTPEELEGRLCGINCLGIYGISGCKVVDGICTEVYEQNCVNDADCVPAQCCHPTSCVPKQQAPNCSNVACTMECREGTLDCGSGSCACVNGRCGVVWNAPATGTPTPVATPTPNRTSGGAGTFTPTPVPTPTITRPAGSDNTITYAIIVLLVIALGVAAYFYVIKKEKPPESYRSENIPE